MIERSAPAVERPLAGSPALPLFAHSVERDRASATRLRRAGRHGRFAAVLAGIALVGVTILRPPRPRLVWNASASAPIGLYAVNPGANETRGDVVIAWPPLAARALAARRRYLPANVPLVKRVRAVAGDRVCALGAEIAVNGHRIARRRAVDGTGRVMPWWRGCVTLPPGSLLLLNDPADSFDGRYFGPSRGADVIGKATPLWTR